MKVVTPTRLLSEAAEVLAGIQDEVVVIGAAALEVALSEVVTHSVSSTRDVDLIVITPTRDVDRQDPAVRQHAS